MRVVVDFDLCESNAICMSVAPEVFEVLASALRLNEDGAVRLDDVEVDFDVRFPEDEQGAKAQKMVDRLIQLSEQKDCTVSRTVEHPTNVSFHNLAN